MLLVVVDALLLLQARRHHTLRVFRLVVGGSGREAGRGRSQNCLAFLVLFNLIDEMLLNPHFLLIYQSDLLAHLGGLRCIRFGQQLEMVQRTYSLEARKWNVLSVRDGAY